MPNKNRNMEGSQNIFPPSFYRWVDLSHDFLSQKRVENVSESWITVTTDESSMS